MTCVLCRVECLRGKLRPGCRSTRKIPIRWSPRCGNCSPYLQDQDVVQLRHLMKIEEQFQQVSNEQRPAHVPLVLGRCGPTTRPQEVVSVRSTRWARARSAPRLVVEGIVLRHGGTVEVMSRARTCVTQSFTGIHSIRTLVVRTHYVARSNRSAPTAVTYLPSVAKPHPDYKHAVGHPRRSR